MSFERLAEAIDDAAEQLELLEETESVVALNRLLSRLEAVTCAAAERLRASGAYAPSGARTPGSFIAWRCRLPRSSANRQVRLGRALAELPFAAAAWRSGELSGSHVALLAGLGRGRSAEALEDFEELLVDKARTLRFDDFERCCRYFEQLADPDGSEVAAEERRNRRDVSLSRSTGGMWFGRITLDEIAGEIVSNELDRLEQLLYEGDRRQAHLRLGREPARHELVRTPSQHRADALVEMARRSGACPDDRPRPAPLFSVLVGYETLKGRILELASGAVASPGSLLPYLDEAILERAVFDPAGRVEVGMRRRLFSGAARRACELRDRRCSHPSCSVPASRCQTNHKVPYEAGGLTSQVNGEMTCGPHNRDDYRDWVQLDEPTRASLVEAQWRAWRAWRAELGQRQAAGKAALRHHDSGQADHRPGEEHVAAASGRAPPAA